MIIATTATMKLIIASVLTEEFLFFQFLLSTAKSINVKSVINLAIGVGIKF